MDLIRFLIDLQQLSSKRHITKMGKKKVGNFMINQDDVLGKGQFGTVCTAARIDNEEVVAVKIIEKQKINEDEYNKNALIREVDIMKNLKSPNIIECLQVHQTPNRVYIFQQLAPDGTLRDLLKKHKRFAEFQGLVLIMQILTGFAELVKNGIIHRDVKASNILVKSGILKLADFGFARNIKSLSNMNSVVGTPAYMAPQVIGTQIGQYNNYSYKSDVWSFGVVCYEILVGKFPWVIKSNNLKELFMQVKDQSLAGVKFPQNVEISTEMKDMICGCLKFHENERYDWNRLFNHPVFKNQKKVFEEGEINIEQAFTKTHLRMSIHCKNINLKKFLKDKPETFKLEEFIIILRAIDEDITNEEAISLFKVLCKGEEVSQKDLASYFKSNSIKLTGIKATINESKNTQATTKIDKIIEEVAKALEEQDLDINELFRKHAGKKQRSLNQEEFNQLMLELCPKLSGNELEQLFDNFDMNQNKSIEFSECYTKLCKIGQVAKVENQELQESLKKMKKK